jgi:isoleucyl-tRNA synthetase
VLEEIFRRVVTWFAPILCFTMEEAWLLRYPGDSNSVHLERFAVTPAGWSNTDLLAKWDRIRALRRVVTGVLEIARRDKVIGASLEAAPVLFLAAAADRALFETVDLAEITITSAAHIRDGEGPPDAFRLADVGGAAAIFQAAEGTKCARCWMVLPEVGHQPGHTDLCRRCNIAVGNEEGMGA